MCVEIFNLISYRSKRSFKIVAAEPFDVRRYRKVTRAFQLTGTCKERTR